MSHRPLFFCVPTTGTGAVLVCTSGSYDDDVFGVVNYGLSADGARVTARLNTVVERYVRDRLRSAMEEMKARPTQMPKERKQPPKKAWEFFRHGEFAKVLAALAVGDETTTADRSEAIACYYIAGRHGAKVSVASSVTDGVRKWRIRRVA